MKIKYVITMHIPFLLLTGSLFLMGCSVDTQIFNFNSEKDPNSESPNPDSGQAANICAPSTYPTLNISNSDALAGTDLEFTINTIGSENLCDIEFNWKIDTTDIIGTPAQLGVDYNASLTGTASIPKGTTSVTIIVSTVNDNRKNGTKEFHLKITDLEKAKFLGEELETSVLGSILDVNPVCNNQADISNDNYGGGSGTNEDPYLLCTTSQFNKIGATSSDWNKYFLQTADIDLATLSTNNYNMIGNVTTPFTGQFDGGNFEIKNLQLETGLNTSGGLFQFVGNSIFKNIKLNNINITVGVGSDKFSAFLLHETSSVGALVGESLSGSLVQISNIELNTINTSGVVGVGGLVGKSLGTLTGENIEGSNIYIRSYFGSFTPSGGSGGLIGTCQTCTLNQIDLQGITDNFQITDELGYVLGGLVGAANTLNLDRVKLKINFPNVTSSYGGGISGTVYNGLWNNIEIDEGVLIANSDVGGLVGSQLGGSLTITKALCICEINALINGGGLFGSVNGNLDISESAFLGFHAMNSQNSPGRGGLIGNILSSSSTVTIRNSYVHSPLSIIGFGTGTGSAGGLIGSVTTSTAVTIQNVFTVVPVAGASANKGCVAGVIETAAWSSVQNSFFDSTVCVSAGARANNNTLTGFSPTTTADMKLATTFSAWPTDIWEIRDGEYPRLRWSPSQ